jgi:hypothetical protein
MTAVFGMRVAAIPSERVARAGASNIVSDPSAVSGPGRSWVSVIPIATANSMTPNPAGTGTSNRSAAPIEAKSAAMLSVFADSTYTTAPTSTHRANRAGSACPGLSLGREQLHPGPAISSRCGANRCLCRGTE